MPFVAVHNRARSRLSPLLAVIALALCLPTDSRGAEVIQYGNAVQDNNYTEVWIDLINNDMGTTYASATLNIDALLGSVADHIITHNSDYSTSTRSNIYSRIFFLPRGAPNGDIANGWNTVMNNTILSITKEGLEPDVWSYGLKMRMSIDIPSPLFDYNHNGIPDVTIGQATGASNLVQNVFVASDTIGDHYPATAYPYTVITAPSGWSFTTNVVGGVSNLTITGYSGASSFLIIPDAINSIPVTAIGEGAFSSRTSLTGVSIPSSVSDIGRVSFLNCLGLSSLELANGVATIGDLTFFACTNLTSITIPASLTNLGMAVFVNNPSLQTFIVSPSNLFFSATNGILFNKTQTTLLQCPSAKTNGLSIPASVVNVGDFSFGSCVSLTSLTIPNGVTNIGTYAFYDCSHLTNAVVPASVVNIGSNAFSWSTSLTNIVFKGNPPSIALPVFDWDDALTVYYYPWTTGWTGSFGGRPTQVMPAYTQWLLNNNFSTNGISSTTNDFDNDGMLNWQEFLAGTCPTNKDDNLAITSIGSGTNAQISWLAKSNVSYQVSKSLDLLGSWLDAPTGTGTNQQALQTTPVDGLLQYADPTYAGASNGFYRVIVVP